MEAWQELLTARLEKVNYTEAQIQARVAELGAQISRHYCALGVSELVVIGILRGATIFMSDLIRSLTLPVAIDFMAISSYGGGTASSGTVRILMDASETIADKHVLVVEDIVDTGLTLKSLQDVLNARKPASLAICTLLSKPSRRKIDIEVDFCGFEIPDEFVVGYGLDYAGLYRNLPFIGVLKPEVYQGGPSLHTL